MIWPDKTHGEKPSEFLTKNPKLEKKHLRIPPGNEESYPTEREKENNRLKSSFAW